jgi:hypothetical protein
MEEGWSCSRQRFDLKPSRIKKNSRRVQLTFQAADTSIGGTIGRKEAAGVGWHPIQKAT